MFWKELLSSVFSFPMPQTQVAKMLSRSYARNFSFIVTSFYKSLISSHLRENVIFHFHIYKFISSLRYISTNGFTVGRKIWSHYPASCL